MKKQITIFQCDLCKKEVATQEIIYPVLFLTEQTEGRVVKPYLEKTKLDLCSECIGKVVKINAHGAQGHNHYFLSEKE